MAKKVLIVEDDLLVRGTLQRLLEEKGLEVVGAGNGKEGLQKAKGVDLVVTDLRMPEMDGLQMVEELRANDDTKQIPVIVLTSDEKTETMNKALESGVTVYLSKATADADAIASQILIALG